MKITNTMLYATVLLLGTTGCIYTGRPTMQELMTQAPWMLPQKQTSQPAASPDPMEEMRKLYQDFKTGPAPFERGIAVNPEQRLTPQATAAIIGRKLADTPLYIRQEAKPLPSTTESQNYSRNKPIKKQSQWQKMWNQFLRLIGYRE